jgi:hypothetical protein
LAKDESHSSCGRMRQYPITRLHRICTANEVLRSDAFHETPGGRLVGQSIRKLEQMFCRVDAFFSIGAKRRHAIHDPIADGKIADARAKVLMTPTASKPRTHARGGTFQG